MGDEEIAIKIAKEISGVELKVVYLKIGKIKESLTARFLKKLF